MYISLRNSKAVFWPKVTAIPLGPTNNTAFDIFLCHIWGMYDTNLVFTKDTFCCGLWEADSDPILYSLLSRRPLHPPGASCVCEESRLLCQVEPSFAACLLTPSALTKVFQTT